jgi:hypothetical protein
MVHPSHPVEADEIVVASVLVRKDLGIAGDMVPDSGPGGVAVLLADEAGEGLA